MRVHMPSALYSYTGRREEARAEGGTLAEVMADLDRQYPGLRFRIVDEQDGIRPHIRIVVNGALASDLGRPLGPEDEIYIIMAMSGG